MFSQRRKFLVGSTCGLGLMGLGKAISLFAANNSSLAEQRVLEFSRLVEGTVIGPDDSGYEGARRTFSFNPRFSKFPALVVRCAAESDVIRTIAFARENELPIAVRSGGHDVMAASSSDGGIIIDLQQLAKIDINGQRVNVGPGVRAGQLDFQLGNAGRALPLVCNPSVGTGGLTLGGGLGWFVGTQGAACDKLTSARVITVDGRAIIASNEQNQDLFWALRGGGGNFGIVTEMEFETFSKPEVIAGVVVYDARLLKEFLAFYQDFMSTAPDELTVEVVAYDGEVPMVAAMAYYSGDDRRAEAVLEPLRSFGPPLADGIRKQEYGRTGVLAPDVAPHFTTPNVELTNEPRENGLYWQGISISSLNEQTINSIDDAMNSAPRGWTFGLGHIMRGAVTQVESETSPLNRPFGSMTVHFDIGWAHNSQAAECMNWVDSSIDSLKVSASQHDYINYMSTDNHDAVMAAYGENYSRLAQIKQVYDVDNVLNGNRNIRPNESNY